MSDESTETVDETTDESTETVDETTDESTETANDADAGTPDEGGETSGEGVALTELADEVKALADTVTRLVGKIDAVAAAQDVFLANGAVVHEEDEVTPDLDAFGMDGVSIDDLDLKL